MLLRCWDYSEPLRQNPPMLGQARFFGDELVRDYSKRTANSGPNGSLRLGRRSLFHFAFALICQPPTGVSIGKFLIKAKCITVIANRFIKVPSEIVSCAAI